MNLEDDFVPIEFWYSYFQLKREYTFIFYDFMNPQERKHNIRKFGNPATYLCFKIKSEKMYPEEGIPPNTPFIQHFPKVAFQRAYARYKFSHLEMAKELFENRHKNLTVKVTFVKTNPKETQFKKLEILK